jgi:hypothetical protein
VPQHADGEAPVRKLDRLHEAVVGEPGGHHSLAELLHALMVSRLHLGALRADHTRGKRAGLEPDTVVGEGAWRVPVQLEAGQVLVERPALDHVQHLHAAADPQHGHVALQRACAQGELEAVALGTRAARLRVRTCAVARRVDVGAAGQDQGVEHDEQLIGGLGDDVIGRQHQSQPTGALNGKRVGARREVYEHLPGRPLSALDRRAYAYDRALAVHDEPP